MNQREPVKKKEGLRASRAIELVGRFPSHRILVVGDVMIDRYVIGQVERLNPEAPVPIWA
jgi:bifunctional ADP-heptose synthase (sugar kinase/adenylyltransferase)